MPEGDTIFRAARTLNRALAGGTVVSAQSSVARVRAETLIGAKVSRVEARGKHLLIHFEDGRALHSHMRMSGSWREYRPGERWRGSPGHVRCALSTEAFVAVCFRAPVVELLSAGELRRHSQLSALGPDLIVVEQLAGGRERLRQDATLPIGEALMAQRLVAGIGNV